MESSDDAAAPQSGEEVFANLRGWIEEKKGDVNEGLELRKIGGDNRGIFAIKNISQGDVLIRLPSALAIDGQDLPSVWKYGTEDRQASPWLKCLSAFWKAQENTDMHIYIQSLPSFYETIWEWSEQEINDYLAGTNTQGGTSVGWKVDKEMTEDRYRTQIRPYLLHCGILQDASVADDLESERFAMACQCLSTRCFHLSTSEDATVDDSNVSDSNGPFLLPLIDMLNHSTTQKCTTLKRNSDGFVMVAERDIKANEEILHSYGDALTASQFLQTFGFVPQSTMEKGCLADNHDLTPGMFSKMEILEACWSVIESQLPVQLAASMEEQGMEDEVWDITVDRNRTAPFLSDDVLVDSGNPLSDEIVTMACLPFLPKCAYQEAASGLLDQSILDDYYLGKLVCSSLLKALQTKLSTYETLVKSGNLAEDQKHLRQLLLSANNSLPPGTHAATAPSEQKSAAQTDASDSSATSGGGGSSSSEEDLSQRRLMYGLTVCIEEKKSLELLRKEIVGILARLDEEAMDMDDAGGDPTSKRQRT